MAKNRMAFNVVETVGGDDSAAVGGGTQAERNTAAWPIPDKEVYSTLLSSTRFLEGQLEDDPSWVAAYGNYPLQRGRGIARFALGTLQLEVQVEDYRLTREEKEGLTVEKLDILPILNVPWFDRRVVCYDAAFDPMQHADVVEVRVYIHAAHGLESALFRSSSAPPRFPTSVTTVCRVHSFYFMYFHDFSPDLV